MQSLLQIASHYAHGHGCVQNRHMGIMHGTHKVSTLAHKAAQVPDEGLHVKNLHLVGKGSVFAKHQPAYQQHHSFRCCSLLSWATWHESAPQSWCEGGAT